MTVFCLLFFAGDPLYEFSLCLLIGIIVGTISSIFISATLPGLLGMKADYFYKKAEEIEALAERP